MKEKHIIQAAAALVIAGAAYIAGSEAGKAVATEHWQTEWRKAANQNVELLEALEDCNDTNRIYYEIIKTQK